MCLATDLLGDRHCARGDVVLSAIAAAAGPTRGLLSHPAYGAVAVVRYQNPSGWRLSYPSTMDRETSSYVPPGAGEGWKEVSFANFPLHSAGTGSNVTHAPAARWVFARVVPSSVRALFSSQDASMRSFRRGLRQKKCCLAVIEMSYRASPVPSAIGEPVIRHVDCIDLPVDIPMSSIPPVTT